MFVTLIVFTLGALITLHIFKGMMASNFQNFAFSF